MLTAVLSFRGLPGNDSAARTSRVGFLARRGPDATDSPAEEGRNFLVVAAGVRVWGLAGFRHHASSISRTQSAAHANLRRITTAHHSRRPASPRAPSPGLSGLMLAALPWRCRLEAFTVHCTGLPSCVSLSSFPLPRSLAKSLFSLLGGPLSHVAAISIAQPQSIRTRFTTQLPPYFSSRSLRPGITRVSDPVLPVSGHSPQPSLRPFWCCASVCAYRESVSKTTLSL